MYHHAISTLRALLDERQADCRTEPGLERLRVALPAGIDPARWLAAQSFPTQLFWADRGRALEVAGIGMAWHTAWTGGGDGAQGLGRALRQAHEMLERSDQGIRIYVGVAFGDDDLESSCWAPLGRYQLIVPRFEVGRDDGGEFFAVNMRVEEGSPAVLRDLARVSPLQHTGPAPEVDLFNRVDNPTSTQWRHSFSRALEAIEDGCLEKVVLARRSRFEIALRASAAHLLIGGRERGLGRAFVYLFQPNASAAFLGASPERLFKRSGRHLQTEAVAGSTARGKTELEDAELGQQLLSQAKERREHELVETSVLSPLRKLCDGARATGPVSLIKLARVQHLYRRFAGVLHNGATDEEIINVLHPTAAIAGLPRREASRLISSVESFARGWYCGLFGWLQARHSDFAVALRCALIQDHGVDVYSGVGLVEGSRWRDEWAELDLKMNDVLGGFFGRHGAPTPKLFRA